MNLIDESLEMKNKQKKDNAKIIARIILVIILILVILIIAIFSYLMYVENSKLKVSLNGQVNDKVKELLQIEDDGTVYIPIRNIASYLGYESYNGEYANKSEDKNKCFIQNENEIVNFTLNSNKIYKLNLDDSSGNYSYLYLDEPVKSIKGNLCITSDGMQKAFNSAFNYNTDTNRITIYTMPYLICSYETKILDYGYTEIDKNFENHKTVLQNMLVVLKGDSSSKKYAVIEADTGKELLEAKYDNILYQEDTGDFLVTSNNKVGIIGKDRSTKVNIMYDSIELMDYDAGLYLVKRDNKYGVIDLKGNTKIYIEYDEIGVDTSKFKENDLMNKYILAGELIPAKRGEKWGFFDINGKQVVDFNFDSLGYIAKSSKDALNLLVIPNYNVVVVCLNEKYTLINTSGEQPFSAFVDDIYMTISGGQKHYYMTANDKTYDVEDYLDRIGVKTNSGNTSNNSTDSNTDNSDNSNGQSSDNNQNSDGQDNNNQENVDQNNDNQNSDNQNNNNQENMNQEDNSNEQNQQQQNDNG